MQRFKASTQNPLRKEAERYSGVFQCPTCGLLWFGRYNVEQCPEGLHGRPVQVALLCRECDTYVPIDLLAEHLTNVNHEHLSMQVLGESREP